MNNEQFANTIAIVGLGLQFPGADSPQSYWERLQAGQDLSSDLRPRWSYQPPLNRPGETAPDCANSYRGYVLDKYPERRPYGQLKELPADLDPLFLLPLAAAEDALAGVKLPHASTGLIMAAIALPTEATSKLTQETLGQIVARRASQDHPELVNDTAHLAIRPVNELPHFFNLDAVGGCGSLVAQAFDLGLGAYTIDAACASSLIAVHLACEELRSHRADAMLAGGLSRPDCLYTQMGFSALKALSRRGQCRPFDRDGDGLMVGEGCGLIVLKRLQDALRDGDTIHALLRGEGISNDLAGSLIAPATEGQLRSLEQAYRTAGMSPQDIDWVECHGTGTPTGDRVELTSLTAFWEEWGAKRAAHPCYLTSVKSMLGHLLTAAGIASLLRVVLSLKHKQYTPQVNYAHPLVDLGATPFDIPTQNETWERRNELTPRRAAVSGFGFGGINAHVIVEEWDPKLCQPQTTAGRTAPESTTKEISTTDRQAEPIAIVGMACHIGSASTLADFRTAVLGGRTLLAPRPASRWWQAEDMLPDSKNTLADLPGAYIEEIAIPVGAYRIPPTDMPALLTQQLLMLQVADQALKDAKVSTAQPRPDAAALIGISLDINTTNYQLRWWLTDLVERWSQKLGLSQDEKEQWLRQVRDTAQRPLDSTATMGALGSIAASRVAREFRFGGPSYAISCEENSGLEALRSACRYLQRGEANLALVGAVDLRGDLRQWLNSELALAIPNPYDKEAKGTSPGEGAVALVVKRLSDAQAQGDHIYAILRGWGTSEEGLEPALQRAYTEAGINPDQISFIEGCGSSAPESDVAELQTISAFFQAGNRPCALGALSGVTGNLGACAGLASLAKAALCLKNQLLPPLPGFSRLNATVDLSASRLHLPQQPAYWFRNRQEGPRCAGVSCRSRSGQFFHAVLSEAEGNVPANGAIEPDQVAVLSLYGNTIQEICANLDSLSSLNSARPAPEAPLTDRALHTLENEWNQRMEPYLGKHLCLSIVAETGDRLTDKINFAYEHLRDHPDQATELHGIYFTPTPLATGKVAFVYPGSGCYFLGMGRALYARFPEQLHSQDLDNRRLADQFMVRYNQPYRCSWPEGWRRENTAILNSDTHKLMFSQVCFGGAMTEVVRSLGIEPQAVIGYSLGESAGMFATHAWPARDDMFERMEHSDLFRQKLSGHYLALRQAWGIDSDSEVDWVVAVLPLPKSQVEAALSQVKNARILIVNTDHECVVGGLRESIQRLGELLRTEIIMLSGVDAVHCDALTPVAEEYRDMHTLPVLPQRGITYYSGCWGRSYDISSDSVANSIVSHGVKGINFPQTIRQAWEDGVRLFIEMGPGGSCTRMIRSILQGLPHYAHTTSMRGRSEVVTLAHMLAGMRAYGLRPRNWSSLSNDEQLRPAEPRPCVHVSTSALAAPPSKSAPAPTSAPAPQVSPSSQRQPAPEPEPSPWPATTPAPEVSPSSQHNPALEPKPTPAVRNVSREQTSVAALEPTTNTTIFPQVPMINQLLSLSQQNSQAYLALLAGINSQLQQINAMLCQPQNTSYQLNSAVQPDADSNQPSQKAQSSRAYSYMISGNRQAAVGGFVRGTKPNLHPETPVFLSREQCLQLAVGKLGEVLGPQFAEVDTYPTRVRLPDEPLMLVDRILSVEGEPLSLKSGRLVTEHDVIPGSWYLDGNRAPVFLSVEAGQADLFLSGWLGIDFQTKGERVYRLLDATVCFHRGLPQPGETIHYDIKIDRFVHQGATWLFFFHYEATIGSELFLTMHDGCAGFFTHQEIRDNRGLVLTEDEKCPQSGTVKPGYRQLVSLQAESYSEAQIDALRWGKLEQCFGSSFSGLRLKNPVRLPGGLLRLIHRVPLCDPHGGRWGLGLVRAEADVHPDDWYLTCHFVDDMVMPGTLMYECCAHALRVLLTRLGWVGEHHEVAYEPVPGCNATLKCRGPVLQSTKQVVYQVEIKEIGYNPAPYVIADALMFADGKIIVGFQNISMQMTGQTQAGLERLWSQRQVPTSTARSAVNRGEARKPAIFDERSLLQFAIGKPSEAFGPEFARFDSEFIARLPGPPYQFLSRIVAIDHPFLQMAPGGWVEAQYDVPSDAWYFQANKQNTMPFCVLLEIPLQACGWLSAYAGSSRSSQGKLQYRNLGGTATLYREIYPDIGTITARVRLTKCSQAGGLIIQSFDFWLGQEGDPIYEGTTTFGFFTPASLANQVGVRGAKELAPNASTPSEYEQLPVQDPVLPKDEVPQGAQALSLPGKALLMCDDARWFPGAGSHGLGFISGTKRVDPGEWFFKAHFFQDPVIPGSLGLESFLQLLKVAAMKLWPEFSAGHRFSCILPQEPHTWIYRGQIIPRNKLVTVEADITEVRSGERPVIKANGYVRVDGITIYEMQDFGLSIERI